MMKPNHLISLLQGDYSTVGVRFDTATKLYTYKTRLKLAQGDWVIVSVKDNLKVVQVVQVHSTPQIDFDAAYEYKWIIDKVDTTEYNRTLATEGTLRHHLDTVERLHKRQAILDILEKTYPVGSPAHDYYLSKIKPLLRD